MGRTITVVKPIQVCTVCNETFPNAHRLNLHMKDAHRKPVPKPALLPTSSPTPTAGATTSSNIFMQFPTNPMMNCAKRGGKNGNGKKYVCNTCSKVFKKACKLKRHLAVHMIVKPFPCLLCDKRFGRKDHLRGHVRAVTSHSDTCACERCRVHYSCDIDIQITKNFTAKRSCKGEESVACTCSICNEELLDMAALKAHFRSEHIEKAMFLEDSGNAMFKSPAINMVPSPKKVSAKNYVNRAGNRQIISHWFCGHCERTFPEKRLLEKHVCCGKPQQDIVVKVVLDGGFVRERDAIVDGGGDREQPEAVERIAKKRLLSVDTTSAAEEALKRPKRVIRYKNEEVARMLVKPISSAASSMTAINSRATLVPISSCTKLIPISSCTTLTPTSSCTTLTPITFGPLGKAVKIKPLVFWRKKPESSQEVVKDGTDDDDEEEEVKTEDDGGNKASSSLLRARLSQGDSLFKQMQVSTDKISIAASNIKTSTWGLKDRQAHLKKIAQSESGPFLCDQCPREFPYIEGKIAHEMMHLHGSTRDIICTICKMQVRDHSKLVRHLRKHTGSKPFVCEQCGKRFARNDHRNIHVASTCSFKRFVPHPSDVPLHFLPQPLTPKDANSSGGPGVLFECKVEVHRCKKCERSFTKRSNLLEHKCNGDDEDDSLGVGSGDSGDADDLYQPYVCQPCDLAFFEESDLNEHIMACHENLPFHCSLCETGFDVGADLVAHYNKYHGNDEGSSMMLDEEPISCKQCLLSFATIDAFSAHLDQDHKKTITPKLQQLAQQLESNNPLKLFERCLICQKVLPNKLELREHMLAEH